MHNQGEYQAVEDKKLIANLEIETGIFKSEICPKNEIIKELLNNDIRQNKSFNKVGETWHFDVTHETSDSQSTCSTSNYTEDSIFESRDVIAINTDISNMWINDQLKMIRQEKHQEHILNTGCKSPSLENTKNNENAKQFSDPQVTKENTNESVETNKEFHWPSGTCTILGDSMDKGINKNKLQKHGDAKLFYFSGARTNDMNHPLTQFIAKQPDYLILHVGSNDATTNISRKIIDDLLKLKCNILKQIPKCRVIVSKPTVRIDHEKGNLTLRNLSKHPQTLNLECIENGSVVAQHPVRKRLHLNSKDKDRLALSFLNQIRKF